MKNILKKLFIVLAIVCTVSLVTNFLASQNSFAEFDGRDGAACPNYLGLTSWDCNVNITDEDSLKTGIWTIIANIATDITVISAYLVLGFVIYGGYLYIFAGGDPTKIASGKKTLIRAFIGLGIVVFANIILNAIRIALGANFAKDCVHNACLDPETVVINTLQWTIGIGGVVAVIFVIYGGILYITSAGDPGKTKKARDAILYSLIGLAIVALAEVITAFVSNAIQSGKHATSYENNIIISKEVNENEKNN